MSVVPPSSPLPLFLPFQPGATIWRPSPMCINKCVSSLTSTILYASFTCGIFRVVEKYIDVAVASTSRHYCIFSPRLHHIFSAAVFYDCITTFHHEVNLFWRGGRTGATILFLINRYLLVAFYIFSFAIQEANPKVCMS